MRIAEVILCKRCGKPTDRHPTAKYCFPCMDENNKENNKISHRKQNLRRKLKNENK